MTEMIVEIPQIDKYKQYNHAYTLALLSIGFALTEALFSTYFGYNDESLTLFGFGVGSFMEVISAIGIAHMINRIKQNENSNTDNLNALHCALQVQDFIC